MRSLLGFRRESSQSPSQPRFTDNAASPTGAPQIPAIQSSAGPLLGFPIAPVPTPSPLAPRNHQRRYTSADVRSTTPTIPESGGVLPAYHPRSPAAPIAIPDRHGIPTYDQAISFSLTSPAGSSSLPRPRASSVLSIRTEGNRLIRDQFATSPSDLRETVWMEEEDDDPFTPRVTRMPPSLNLVPLPTRRNTEPTTSRPPSPPTSSSTPSIIFPPDDPPPPDGPPGYSAHLASDECRIISTVHMEHNHPAAAFFSAMTSSALTANPVLGSTSTATTEQSTGGKKFRLVLPRGSERYRTDGTGPLFVRMGRGGSIDGIIEVGKVDHVTDLEVAILGFVNTSYYIRGQYTLIDTLPLARRRVVLYPTTSTSEGFSELSTGLGRDPPPAPTHAQATGGVIRHNTSTSDLSIAPTPETIVVGKDTFLAPDQSFSFSLQMPDHHYRDSNIELPPSASIVQVGMQASIEYVLRVKITRKGWRMNDTIGVPIIYEPRAYIAPRRLRMLSYDDALNPGWRTVRLNGGKPINTDENNPRSNTPGVEVLLLLPSPPILFVPFHGDPPPIPFHLNFHSSSTLPLSTFSDPKESRYIIRLMRVASMRIGSEKDIRRMEIPSVVEIWQEGGERITLGDDANPAGPSESGNRPPSRTERRRSFTDRRPSFLRRRQSSATAAPGTSPTETDQPLARQASNLPTEPAISEEGGPSDVTSPVRAPLTLGATDVHLFGQLTIKMPQQTPVLFRTLVQSFMCPEVGITYVLEVGIQPKKGAVKETFSHIWGGGLIEVVLGHRTSS